MAAQVAAETGTAQEGQAPAEGVDHLARLRAQTLDCWDKPLSLSQIILDAEKHGVADQEVPLKDGRVVMFRELLNARIAELDQAAQGGGERAA